MEKAGRFPSGMGAGGREKGRLADPQAVFTAAVAALAAIALLRLFFGWQGENFFALLHTDPSDTLMDLFNSIFDSRFPDPYGDRGVIYPPLMYMLYDFWGRMLPWGDVTAYGLRNCQQGLVLAAVLSGTVLAGLWRCVSGGGRRLAPALLLGSAPFLFALERGNSILFAVLFLLLFVQNYRSDSRVRRELALACLAVSASIKLYPAAFGLLLILEKRWKEAARCVLYGAAAVLLPFWYFNGWDSLRQLLQNVSAANGVMAGQGFGLRTDLTNLTALLGAAFGGGIPDGAAKLLFAAMMLYTAGAARREWIRYGALTLLVVALPGFSYTYCLAYFTVPLLAFFSEEKPRSGTDWLYTALFIGIFGLFPVGGYKLFPFEKTYKYGLTLTSLVELVCVYTLAAALFAQTVCDRLPGRFEKLREAAPLGAGLLCAALALGLILWGSGSYKAQQYYLPVEAMLEAEGLENGEDICFLTQGSAYQSARFGHEQRALEKKVQDLDEDNWCARWERVDCRGYREEIWQFFYEEPGDFVIDAGTMEYLFAQPEVKDAVESGYVLAAEQGDHRLYLRKQDPAKQAGERLEK